MRQTNQKSEPPPPKGHNGVQAIMCTEKRSLRTAILKARVIEEYLEEKENNPNITKEKNYMLL